MDSAAVVPQVPWPPDTGAMDPTYQLVFTVLLCVVTIGFVIYAARVARQQRSSVPFLMLIGGGLACLIEPIIDYTGLVWFYREGQWVLFEAFGRPIPVWIVPTYIFFVGGQALYTLTRLEKGETMAGIWRLYGIYFVVNILLEEPPLHFGLYTYYGAQPFQPFLLPLWWPLINAAMPIVAATVIHCVRRHLHGLRVLAVVPLIPMADIVANGTIGWPLWIALNSSDSLLVTYLAGGFSVLLAGILLYVIALAVGSDSPARSASTDDLQLQRI